MAAYLVALVDEVLDGPGLQEYAGGAAALMAKFGGKYVCASFAPEAAEGQDKPAAAAIAEFPSMDELRSFWNSPEYEPLRQRRHESAKVRIIFAEGAPGA